MKALKPVVVLATMSVVLAPMLMSPLLVTLPFTSIVVTLPPLPYRSSTPLFSSPSAVTVVAALRPVLPITICAWLLVP